MTDEVKRGRGRPKKLNADAATLSTLRGLGLIQATDRECAAALEVALQTFVNFLAEPGVRDVFEDGKANGRISLRRKQFELAMKGDRTMLVWLGKNMLGQSDKVDTTLSGPGGAPIELKNLTHLSDDELNVLAKLDTPKPLTDGTH